MFNIKQFYCFLFLCFGSQSSFGQGLNKLIDGIADNQINHIVEEIILDGILDEEAWQDAEVLSGFSQYRPIDSIAAKGSTEIRVLSDGNYIYVSAICKSIDNDFVVQSLKRDYGFGSTDNISFLFDTFGDKTNCYLFGMNAYGARREAWISNGGKGRGDFDPSWDNKWFGESKIYNDHWICELAVPLKSLRYKEGAPFWRFNAYRNDAQCNEISIWINMPREFILMDMNYMGRLVWENPLEKSNKNISIIPYAIGSVTRDFEDIDQFESKLAYNFGGDVKIGLGSSMNLDLTVNPDFSQVEVDRQVTNLDRFEIFFPERRQFFLENADLFGGFGGRNLNPFFSRRIGVSTDTLTGSVVQNTILGGARVTGKLNQNLRLGVMSIQAASQSENDLPAFYYSNLSLEQKLFDRSTLAFLFVNKQALNFNDFSSTNDPFDRLLGTEFRLRSENNFWSGKVSYFQSINPGDYNHKLASFNEMEYNRRSYRIKVGATFIGNGFDAEMGFVPRKDILRFDPEFVYRIFPNSQKIVQHDLFLRANSIYKIGEDDNVNIEDFGLEEQSASLGWNIRYFNNSRLEFRTSVNELTLLEDFDPTRVQSDDVFLLAGSKYLNTEFRASYNSDSRKAFRFRVNGLASKFYNGQRYNANVNFRYTFIPFGNVSIDFNYNNVKLPAPFENANLWLISPRLDYSFSKDHFLTAFVQYNNQLENLGINTRYQWRFAPASDLFIVYTDNYTTDGILPTTSRNRGVVLKLNYWLNL